MARIESQKLIRGEAQLVSPWFSNNWSLFSHGVEIARLRRIPRLYISTARFPDGTEWTIEPDGFAVVKAVDAQGTEVARITRRSWWGRRWDVAGAGFAYELVSDPIPRRWRIEVGGSTLAEIRGSLISYNAVTIDAPLSIPVAVAVLAWHVIARPWEAAAAPRGLVPRTGTADSAVVAATEISNQL